MDVAASGMSWTATRGPGVNVCLNYSRDRENASPGVRKYERLEQDYLTRVEATVAEILLKALCKSVHESIFSAGFLYQPGINKGFRVQGFR